MIIKLILKDLTAYKKNIILNFLAFMILGNIFIFRYYPWHVYMMYGYLAFVFISTFFSFIEINKNAEALTCSLPVSRSGIVIARYLTSAVLMFGGLALWYLNGFVAGAVYTDAATDFNRAAHLKVLFIAVFFIVLQTSIFLPALFKFRLIGTVLTFVVALVAAVITVVLIFRPYSRSFNSYFVEGELVVISILTSIMVAAPALSLVVSLSLFKRKDI
ncbi:MAG: ABC-2 transporter permease [Ignavibacteriales bacterium]|nr:ABC-2 transporter permease [Ignavibacteriales bacterium]